MSNKDKEPWYIRWFSILQLETTTPHGRINLAGVVIIAAFCLLYTASDWLSHLISATEGVIKTIALKEEIHYEYESVGLVQAVAPIVIVFVLCLVFIAWHEKKKKND